MGADADIYIFGAGHIGKALVYHLKNLNFKTTIIDIRQKETDQIEHCETITVENYAKFIKEYEFKENCYFIVATHSHELDYIVLNSIYSLDIKPKYIGAVASAEKSKTIRDRLKKNSAIEPDFSILHMPVGLKIGGNTPDFIAISILSELISVFFENHFLIFLSLFFQLLFWQEKKCPYYLF